MRRLVVLVMSAVALGCLFPASSQAQQSISLYGGGFVLNGYHSRIDNGFSDDVLVNNYDFLSYDIDDFHNWTFGGEYTVGLGDVFEAGMGIGFYQKTVTAIDADFVDTAGNPVFADLRLRIVPLTATFRVLPLGRRGPMVPYFGAGVGILQWNYQESGDFVDASDQTIFHGEFTGNGTAVGPLFLGGLRVPIGAFDVGGEIRYQHAEGDLPRDQDFSGSKIDLGGWSYLATFNIKF